MFQYTKKCSTRQKRRARRQNCKVERSATVRVGRRGRYVFQRVAERHPPRLFHPGLVVGYWKKRLSTFFAITNN